MALSRGCNTGIFLTLLLVPLILASDTSRWQRFRAIGRGPRQEQAVTALGTDIYIIGGVIYDFNSTLQTVNFVEIFDTVSDSWSMVAPLPLPVNHANAATVDGKVYVLGSLIPVGPRWDAIPNSWFYSPFNDSWTELAPQPEGTARGSSAVGVLGSTIYLAGGTTYQEPYVGGTQDSVNTVSSYDTVTNTWNTDFPPLPEPRQHVGAAVVNETMYVLGGRENGANLVQDTVFALDLDNVLSGWKTLSPMPTARGGLGCGTLGGKIYCVGGENPDIGGHGVYKQNEVYDVGSDSWETLEYMAVPRHGTNAVGVDGKLYVPGGGTVTGGGPVGIMDAYVPR
jgi:N-acetylneuraminic acid mutarotase